MYVPRAFEESRLDILHQTIRDVGVGIVVSNGPEGLIATHVPVELDLAPEGPDGAHGGAGGVLRCHFTRPNPHATLMAAGAEVLVIFQGPQTYITPNWYPTKAESGKVVPTWNYATVHVYGTGRCYDDPARLRRHLDALSAHFEAGEAQPWRPDDAPADFINQLMGSIVGVEIRIDRIEGKWKMSQNRPLADREGVVVGLRRRGQGQDLQVADAVAAAGESGSDAV